MHVNYSKFTITTPKESYLVGNPSSGSPWVQTKLYLTALQAWALLMQSPSDPQCQIYTMLWRLSLFAIVFHRHFCNNCIVLLIISWHLFPRVLELKQSMKCPKKMLNYLDISFITLALPRQFFLLISRIRVIFIFYEALCYSIFA